MNKQSIFVSLIIASAMGLSHVKINAEEVAIPVGARNSAASMGVETPRRGMSKLQVENSFGPPDSIEGPVGEPPIYFWEYPKFTVYFESDVVLHTVAKYVPSNN